MKAPFAPLCTRLPRLARKYTIPHTTLTPSPPPLRTMHPASPPLAARPIDDPPFLEPEEFAHVVAQLGDARTSAQKRETLLRLIGIDPAQTVPVPSPEVDGGAGARTLESAEEKKEAESESGSEQEVAGHDEPAAAEQDVGEHEAPQNESAVPRRMPGTTQPASQLAPAPSESGQDAGSGKKHSRSGPDDKDEAGSCSGCSEAQAGSGRADDTRPAKVARPSARERLAS